MRRHAGTRPVFVILLLLSVGALAGCDAPGGGEIAGDPRSDEASPVAAPSAPDAPAHGETQGQPFRLTRAEIQNDILTLHGEGGRRFFVFLFLDEGESAAGRRVHVEDAEIGDPHVHVHYASDDGVGIDTFMEDYSLDLQFGEPVGGKLPGRIELRLPESSRSFVRGTFEAEMAG